jgi:hypothetical protein
MNRFLNLKESSNETFLFVPRTSDHLLRIGLCTGASITNGRKLPDGKGPMHRSMLQRCLPQRMLWQGMRNEGWKDDLHQGLLHYEVLQDEGRKILLRRHLLQGQLIL